MITMNHTTFAESQQQSNFKQQNYAPFLAKSKREFPLINKSQSPPIGSYEIPSCFDKNQIDLQLQHSKITVQKVGPVGHAVFKSSINRLEETKNQYPGPAQYNIIQKKNHNTSQRELCKPHHKFKFINRQNIFSSPSIPHSKLKFGYLKSKDGQLKIFQKSAQQVAEEKRKRKKYLSLLSGEKKYTDKKLYAGYAQSDTIAKSIKEKIQALQQVEQSQILKQKDIKSTRQHQIKINKQRYSSNTQLKKSLVDSKLNNSLGPGYYQVNLSTIRKKQKKQAFQFFGSSQLRFKQLIKEDQPQYQPLYTKSPSIIRAEKIAILQKLKKKQEKINEKANQKPQNNKSQIYLGSNQYPRQLKRQQKGGRKVMIVSKHRKNNSTLQMNSKKLVNLQILESYNKAEKQNQKQMKKIKKPVNGNAFVNHFSLKPSTQQFLQQMNQSRRVREKPTIHQKKSLRDFNFGSWTPRFQSNSLSKNENTNYYSYLQNYQQKQINKKPSGSYINKSESESLLNNNPGPGQYDSKFFEKKKSFNIKYVR